MSQTQVLWASNTPKEGIFVDKKTRRVPLKGDCLGQLNVNSMLPQPRTLETKLWAYQRSTIGNFLTPNVNEAEYKAEH